MAHRTVSDVMTSEVVGLDTTATVLEAAEQMRDQDIGDVLVLQDGRLRGVVTDRDLVLRVLAEHRSPETTTVAQVCSTDPVAVRPDTSVEDAVKLLREHAIRRLPVVTADDRATGMVSIGDLAVSEDSASALADISAAPPNE